MNDRIKKIAGDIYKSDDMDFAEKLLQELSAINMEDMAIVAAYFIRAEIGKAEIKNLIIKEFGNDVIKNIELLQRLGKVTIPKEEKSILPLRKQFIELTSDLKIIIIKLFERLTTIKEALRNNSSNLNELAEECLHLYSPIAHRLGVRHVYNVMEDIAFKVLYPEDYQKLNTAIEKRRTHLEKKLKEMSRVLQTKLFENGIKATIHSRVKRLYSIFRKIQNQHITIDKIYDLMALRVIIDSPENCYITLGVVHRNWIPIENRFRDWITFPKPNGYRSIQTTIIANHGDKFEIQIRTDEMHREAEYGSAAHWAYKEQIKSGEYWISRLKEFLENDNYFADPFALQDLLKSEMKRDFIHVLTPKGQIKTLPLGASAIDFAFAVHTEVGFKASGARINGKFAKLKTILNTGDVVDIVTSKTTSPSLDWLNFVNTSQARSKISLWIKKNQTQKLLDEGKRIWTKYKKKYASKLEGHDEDQALKQNLTKVGYKSIDDFYSALGMNSLKTSQSLLRKLYPSAFKRQAKPNEFARKSSIKNSLPAISVEGMQKIETVIAGCCHPIKGEPIIAFVTKLSQIKIHSQDCPVVNAKNIEQERLKKAEWLSSDALQSTKLMLISYDYNAMFKDAVECASEFGLPINSMERKSSGKDFTALIMEVEVKDLHQLNDFIRKLTNSAYIRRVERI